jgi:hypothetical protein
MYPFAQPRDGAARRNHGNHGRNDFRASCATSLCLSGMPRRMHPFETALIVIAMGYALYSAGTETGPYRWLAELQGRWFGGHYPKLTFAAMIVVGAAAAALVAPIVLRIIGAKAEPGPPMSARSQVCLTVLAGVACAAGAVVTGWLGAQAGGRAPVEIAGVARGDLAVSVEVDRTVTDYIPLTPPTWQPGQPVNIVLRHAHGDAAPRGPCKGALIEDGVPAIARPGFEREGVTLTAPVYLLDPTPMAGGIAYFGAALVLGAIALSCLLSAALSGPLRRARERRTSSLRLMT